MLSRLAPLLACWLLAALPAAQETELPPKVRKLNGPLARLATRDVASFRLSADGTRAFYLSDAEVDDDLALYSVPTDGSSAAVRLSQSFPPTHLRVDPDFQVSPDASFAVYRLFNGFREFHLYSAAGRGGSTPVQLDPYTISFESVETGQRISADGMRVVYRADRTADDMLELWSVPIDGSAAPLRLNAPLPAGGDVLDFALTSDGTRAVYRADQLADEVFELFVVPLDGSAPPLRLNLTLVSGGDVVGGYRLAPSGNRVVYVADQDRNGTFAVYTVPLDASQAPVPLSPTNSSQNFEPEFVITGDGAFVVYRFFGPAKLELFGAPIDGSSAAVNLTRTIHATDPGVLPGFRSGPGGTVLFRAVTVAGGSLHLFSVPANAATAPARLDDLPDFGGQVLSDFGYATGGLRALFRAERASAEGFGLFSAPADGSSAPLDLAGGPVPGGDVLAFQERDGRVSYAGDVLTDELVEVFQVPLDGSAPPAPVTDPLPATADVQLDLALAPGGRVVLFRSDQRRDETFELFASRALEPDLALNPPFDAATDRVGTIAGFQVAGERVVYAASEITWGVTELHSVPLHGGGGSVVLGPDPALGNLLTFEVSPDQRHVVFGGGSFARRELYVVPSDGSAPPVRKSGDLAPNGSVFFGTNGLRLSADSRWLVYFADQRVDQQFELFVAPLEGSDQGVLLTPMRPDRDVASFVLTPDSKRAVYVADQDSDERYELYSVPLDRSSPPVRIAAMQNAGGGVGTYAIAADSQRVVYLADQLFNDQLELFVTRIDGLIPTRRLSQPMVVGHNVLRFEVASDLGHVLYQADRDVDEVVQLFSVPLSGSSAQGVELSPPLTRATRVLSSRLSPDGQWALYTDRLFQLFSAPIDGHAPARLLHGNFQPMRGAFSFTSTPDSARAVYLADPDVLQRFELFSTPIDGSGAPVRLNPALRNRRRVLTFSFGPDGDSLGYLANQEKDDEQELYLVPVDGSAPARKMNAPLPAGGDVTSFQFGATESEAVYLADQDTRGVHELYVTTLPTPRQKVQR